MELGGTLRCVRFHGEQSNVIEIENTVFRAGQSYVDFDKENDMARVVAALRDNDCIVEKSFGDVSSFNFSTRAFLKGIWDAQTIRARGLFIDTKANKVKARSYDKFFNLEERPETSLSKLSRTMQFPVDIFLKENGYLGICASDGNGNLFTASKTSTSSDHAKRFSNRLKTSLGKRLGEFSKYLEDNNLSAVFEVIEPEDDPHIVEYDEPRLVMLALVRNNIHFEQLPYSEMCLVADHFNLEPKRILGVARNFKEFCAWVNNLEDVEWTLRGKPIEGIVAEDRVGNMVKIKGQWYRKWKSIRGVLKDIARRGRSSKVEMLRRHYDDAYVLYEAAREYSAAHRTRRKKLRGLVPPPAAENVIMFRTWYENEYLPGRN